MARRVATALFVAATLAIIVPLANVNAHAVGSTANAAQRPLEGMRKLM